MLDYQTLSNKVDFITDYIDAYYIDILAITETWLNKKDTSIISKLKRIVSTKKILTNTYP